MSIFDGILAKIAPHECVGCTAEGSLLCVGCRTKLRRAADRCYHCFKPSPEGRTCPECAQISPLDSLRSAVMYEKLAKKLVWKLKSGGAQSAATVMAACMLPGLSQLPGRQIVVSVPTATTRIRQRGYDQARLLAKQLAFQARLPWIDCMARSGQAHQVGANRAQRMRQLDRSFRVSQARFVRGAHIILVDDVVTTGATLEMAAKVLKQAGAASVGAITFARADKY